MNLRTNTVLRQYYYFGSIVFLSKRLQLKCNFFYIQNNFFQIMWIMINCMAHASQNYSISSYSTIFLDTSVVFDNLQCHKNVLTKQWLTQVINCFLLCSFSSWRLMPFCLLVSLCLGNSYLPFGLCHLCFVLFCLPRLMLPSS